MYITLPCNYYIRRNPFAKLTVSEFLTTDMHYTLLMQIYTSRFIGIPALCFIHSLPIFWANGTFFILTWDYRTTNFFILRQNVEYISWWRNQMETFSALLALCVGKSPVTGEVPLQRPVTRSFSVFFDLRLNKRLSKQSRRRWFKTPSPLLWRHCNNQSLSWNQSLSIDSPLVPVMTWRWTDN